MTNESAIRNLHAAKEAKNDEFYTQLEDIEKELNHYKGHFKDKVVYCNCDNPEWSNFVKYFRDNFDELELKDLLASYYNPMDGSGDFRSEESIRLLQQADIVVTNPPFSLFREYITQLVEHKKKFLIVGNMNAITYKEIFPLIKENKIWMGVNFNKTMNFRLPDNYEKWNYVDENGNKYGKGPAICWFTNLSHKKRNEECLYIENTTRKTIPSMTTMMQLT